MSPFKVYKIDNDYIVLREDAPIPAVGQDWYARSASEALSYVAMQCRAHGIKTQTVGIVPNELASVELIQSHGFRAIF